MWNNLDDAKMTGKNLSKVRTILAVVLLVVGPVLYGVAWTYGQAPIAQLCIAGPKAWQFVGIPVNQLHGLFASNLFSIPKYIIKGD
jgi:hypothetical protein